MAKLTHDQLQAWYARLKTALYEQANVDLTRKEDLGRIRIMRINDWHPENPDIMPDVDMIYPFIPHRPLRQDEQSADPLLSYYFYDPPAPDKADAAAYQQWLLSSSSTAPTDDLLQELYDMSAEGQLMVYDGTTESGIHQIQNQNGEITITDKFDNIQFDLPPEVVEPPKDEKPALPIKPAEPEQPGEAPKGFWIRVGYLFGIPTKYTEYVHRKKAYDQYLKELTAWEKVCAERMTQWEAQAPDRMEQLERQTAAFNRYYQEVTNFFMNPLNRFSIAWRGSSIKVMQMDDETIVQQRQEEETFWAEQHKNTLLGRLQTSRDEAVETYQNMLDVKKSVDKMFGPVYKQNTGKILDGILEKHTDVPAYAVPVMSEAKISDKHAAMICLAALADSSLLAQNLADDRLDGLGGQERYQKIMDAFLLKGEEGSDPLFAYIREARAAGIKAMQEYAQGNPDQLARILSNCIRRQNELASYQTDPYALKSFGITAGLLEVLDAHPKLMARCGLNPEEIQQARTHAATYQINETGLQAKADLLGYALHRKDLTQDALHSAAADVLFMNTMNAQVSNKQDIHALASQPKAVQMVKQTLMKQESANQLTQLDRTELGKAVSTPQSLFAKMAQLNPESQKAPQEKGIDQPQISQPQPAPAPKSDNRIKGETV